MTDREFLKLFSLKITHYMNIRDFNQKDISERADISRASISEYISCKMFPSIHTIIRIANTFGITVSELLDFSELTVKEDKENEIS